MTATQATTVTTLTTLTGHTFTIPPGKSLALQAILVFTAAATTTGARLGYRVTHGAGASANAVGSHSTEVAITSAAAASSLRDGDNFNVAAGAAIAQEVLGTATVAGNNSAHMLLNVRNNSTNVNTTVEIQFGTEVAGSAVTAQIGTGAVGLIG